MLRTCIACANTRGRIGFVRIRVYVCVCGRRKYRIKPSRKQSVPPGELHRL